MTVAVRDRDGAGQLGGRVAEEVLGPDAERRVADARTKSTAMVAEQQGQVEAMIARATAALEAEEARVEQV
ncbi:MAG: hypothetical protein AAGJ97_06315, partial [Planctomycetota bacterium]